MEAANQANKGAEPTTLSPVDKAPSIKQGSGTELEKAPSIKQGSVTELEKAPSIMPEGSNKSLTHGSQEAQIHGGFSDVHSSVR